MALPIKTVRCALSRMQMESAQTRYVQHVLARSPSLMPHKILSYTSLPHLIYPHLMRADAISPTYVFGEGKEEARQRVKVRGGGEQLCR